MRILCSSRRRWRPRSRSPPAAAARTPRRRRSSSNRHGPDEKTKHAMLDFARCMRQHGVDMPDPKFDGGGARHAVGGRSMAPEHDARGRARPARSTRSRSSRRRSPRRSRRSSSRRRWRTRAACASTASTCRIRSSARNGGVEQKIGGAASSPTEPEVPGRAEGVRARGLMSAGDGRGSTMRRRAHRDRRRRCRRRPRRRRRAGARRNRHAGAGRRPPRPARATATVERRDLVDRENVDGTLGYADESTLARRPGRAR